MLKGIFGFDDVWVGSGNTKLHVVNATVGLIIKDAITLPDFDGLIGLAYPQMSIYGTPLFDSIINQKLLFRN
jgi:hypothetical protein